MRVLALLVPLIAALLVVLTMTSGWIVAVGTVSILAGAVAIPATGRRREPVLIEMRTLRPID